MKDELTVRQRIAIILLLFIIKLVNPTSYTHEIDALKKAIEEVE